MSTAEDPLARVLRTGLVAILRAPSGDRLADACEALLAGGVEVIEVTFTVPRAERVLETVADRLGDRILLGAGTVLDAATARVAISAGAQFLVSPAVQPEVIQTCRLYGKLAMPGAFTPTEIVQAWQAGADIVKVFPSDCVGPKYLKALRGPLPQIRLMPTGGITAENCGEFIKAGACALGVGGALAEPKALMEGDLARIEAQARRFVEAVKAARESLKQ